MGDFLDELGGTVRVSRTTLFDFNDTADHVLYTVPTGFSFIPTLLVVHTLSADMSAAVFSAGLSTAKTDFVATITCSGANGVTKILVIRPDYNATPAAGSGLMTIIPAASTFVIDMLTAAGGACTGTVDLFGYLFS